MDRGLVEHLDEPALYWGIEMIEKNVIPIEYDFKM